MVLEVKETLNNVFPTKHTSSMDSPNKPVTETKLSAVVVQEVVNVATVPVPVAIEAPLRCI